MIKLSLSATPAIAIAVGLTAFSVPARTPRGVNPATKRAIDYAYVNLIFRKYDCVDCHSDAPDASAKLNLTTPEGLTRGSKYGRVIRAGDSAHSRLFELIPGKPGRQMPPEGTRLSSEEVATIRKWVDQGAVAGSYGTELSRYYAAKRTSRWSDALQACRAIEGLRIEGVPTRQIAVKSRLPIFEANGDEQGWYAAAKAAVDFRPLNATLLNLIAWRILDPQSKLKRRDVGLGFKAASLAVEDTQGESGAILDSLAWAYFYSGDRAKAIETENQALSCRDARGVTLQSLEESMNAFLSNPVPNGPASSAAHPPVYEPPGRLVDIGGQNLHVILAGKGTPAVVFEAGSGDCGFGWTLVQRQVSKFAKTVSYDRAGYGWSDPSARPRTLGQVALELHAAVRKLRVKRPFVLVGQSYGGFVVREYARRFPAEVAGMVLVDSMHEDSRVVYGGAAHHIREEGRHTFVPEPMSPRAASHLEFGGGRRPPVCPSNDADGRKWIDRMAAWSEAGKALEVSRSDELKWSSPEIAAWSARREDAHAPLGKIPLYVLSAGSIRYEDTSNATAAELLHERRALQRRLAGLSRNSKQVFDMKSGHNIQLDDPEPVAEAIREVVDAVRTHCALRP